VSRQPAPDPGNRALAVTMTGWHVSAQWPVAYGGGV